MSVGLECLACQLLMICRLHLAKKVSARLVEPLLARLELNPQAGQGHDCVAVGAGRHAAVDMLRSVAAAALHHTRVL